MTRNVIASPVYWLALGAFVAGHFVSFDSPWWISAIAIAAIAIVAGSIERWYVTSRAKALATQAIRDAAAMRPDVFR